MKNTTASANLISLLLMLLLASQVVATDMYLPALPQIANDLSSSIGQVQWTLTAYIISFGFMQLVAGTISDRYGRRRTLLWGLAIYTLAGILGAAATSLPFLLLSRVVQGAATAAAVISARAIIRDQYSGAAGLGIMARSMTGMSVIGVLAPVFGGLVTEYVGWHITMAMIAVFGVLTWCTVFFYFTENHAVKEQDISVTAMHFMTHQKFLFSSLLAGFSYSGAIAFLMLSPFVFIGEFGMSRVAYGVLPALCSLAFLAGTLVCRKSLTVWPVPHVVKLGASLSLIGGVSEFLLWHFGYHTVLAMVIPQCIYMLGHGFHQPCGQGGAVAPFPDCAGRAAAWSGFLITSTAFVVGQLISHSAVKASETLVLTMLSLAILLVTLSWFAIPRAYSERTLKFV
ncbi:multidrug effflux MFS transporter [Undibacterium sp. RuRC25W]|uniref:multidrug effflux MFS transporter n=1 Tax=Undibacterium sp. RuRC25W TaxID=3413047 RepID=UPI003BF02B9F